MAAIKTIDKIGLKWATVTPQRVGDYEEGVRNPVGNWAAATVAANDAWKQGVQAAVSRDGFSKGVTRAGNAAWQKGAVEKGPTRWSQGVSLGQDAYTTGFAPYREAIARVVLPPGGPRRDPRNLARVKAVVDALIAVKVSRQGA